jgi:endonuclease/exonuclease/phosphatase (EEP) superfamily protein YafD
VVNPDVGGTRSGSVQTVDRLATAALVVLSAATLAGLLGRIWWVFDLAAAFKVQSMLGFLILAAVFALLRTRGRLLLCLVGLLVSTVPVASLFLAGPDQATASEPALRLMFLNTEIRGADPDSLITELELAQHDLVLLSAATDNWADTLQNATIPYQVVLRRAPGTDLEWVVLARPDLELESSPISLGGGGRDAVVLETRIDDTPVLILAMHPPSPITAELAAIHSRQMSAAANWVRAQGDPVIVIGDLNATPWSSGFDDLLELGGMLDSQVGLGPQASWPARLGPLGIPIDHALHTPELKVLERSLGPSHRSDHRSLRVVFAVERS